MNYLAIDYGLQNIGLAISLNSPLAEPLSSFKPKSKHHTFSTITRLIEVHQINHLIIGLPSGKLKSTIEKFAAQLKQITQLPITFIDEKHSSKQAQSMGKQAGKTKTKIKQQEHQLAAAVILQNFLYQQPSSPSSQITDKSDNISN